MKFWSKWNLQRWNSRRILEVFSLPSIFIDILILLQKTVETIEHENSSSTRVDPLFHLTFILLLLFTFYGNIFYFVWQRILDWKKNVRRVKRRTNLKFETFKIKVWKIMKNVDNTSDFRISNWKFLWYFWNLTLI